MNSLVWRQTFERNELTLKMISKNLNTKLEAWLSHTTKYMTTIQIWRENFTERPHFAGTWNATWIFEGIQRNSYVC